jgi:hypothetical protein
MAKAKVSAKYTAGLKESTAAKRKAEIRKRTAGKVKGKDLFKPLAGDTVGKENLKPSKYTKSLGAVRKQIIEESGKMKGKQNDRFIKAVSKVTGIPKSIINEVFEKGLKAWTIGHRPGATPAQWARARVYSFLQKGKTVTSGADQRLYAEAKKATEKKSLQFKLK